MPPTRREEIEAALAAADLPWSAQEGQILLQAAGIDPAQPDRLACSAALPGNAEEARTGVAVRIAAILELGEPRWTGRAWRRRRLPASATTARR